MRRAAPILASLLVSGVGLAQVPAGPQCDSIIIARAVRAERTVTIVASPADSNQTLPRPLADEVLEAVAASFKLPEKIALQIYSEPVRHPGDSTGKGKAEWVHPSLGAFVRVTLDRSGAARRIVFLERTYDIALDSAFAGAVRTAFFDTAAVAKRLAGQRGDSTMIDVELSTEGWMDKKERAARDKKIAKGKLLVLPIARVVLPHYPDARPVKPLKTKRQLQFPERQLTQGNNGFVLVRAVMDTTGHMVAIWIAASTHHDFETAVLSYLREAQYQPATIGGCAVPTRVGQPFNFTIRNDPPRRIVPIPPQQRP